MQKRTLLYGFALTLLAFSVVWTAAIWHWHSTNASPNGTEIVTYLIVLPIGILAIFLLAAWGIRIAKARNQGAPESETEVEPQALHEREPSLAWNLTVRAAAVHFASGSTSMELMEAAESSERPTLHDRLKNEHGFPIFAAEVAEITNESIEYSALLNVDMWTESSKRALLLAEKLVLQFLDTHHDALASPFIAASRPNSTNTPMARLEWLAPSDWDEHKRLSAKSWLTQRLAVNGWSTTQVPVEIHACANGDEAWQRLDQLILAFNGTTTHQTPYLLLATDSNLDEHTVSEWEHRHCLYGTDNKEGLVPGEGACALLVAPPSSDFDHDLARLHRFFHDTRSQPLKTAKSAQDDTLQTLLAQAMTCADMTGEIPGKLVSDSDLRASRTAEAMQLAERLDPEQEASELLLPLGIANGESGAALTLAVIAVAAHAASNAESPALTVFHRDASLRAVAVVTPPLKETGPTPDITSLA